MRSGVTSTDQTLFLQTMTKHMFSRWLNLYNFQSLPYRSRSCDSIDAKTDSWKSKYFFRWVYRG